MIPFTAITARAAVLDIINIDTDMIIPKQFLTTILRTGLGSALFHEMRYDNDGKEIPTFPLNRPEYRNAGILVAGANFGCGSSREHAPWALLDFGIRAIIAPGFADIFYNNCFKNGILPVVLPEQSVRELMAYAAKPDNEITVDLQSLKVRASGVGEFTFNVDDYRRHCLLNGLDDIGLTLQKSDLIDAFEARQKQNLPWLYQSHAVI